MRLGNGNDIDVAPGRANQEMHAFESARAAHQVGRVRAASPCPGHADVHRGTIWGNNHFTLNCVGYDHSWVKQYVYEDDAAPLLPKGTILHIIGFLDTTAGNRNLADSRNWAGGGRRSVANMFIDLGYAVELTEEQFQAEMAERRERMASRNVYDVGCPLCWAEIPAADAVTTEDGGQE